MQVKRLTLTNVRAFQQAEFEFQPGMNLLVGVNGAGKSTVLDVLRIMFSKHLPRMVKAGNHQLHFQESDIHQNQPFMTIVAEFRIDGTDFTQTFQTGSANAPETKELNTIVPPTKQLRTHQYRDALVVYFSPRRSLVQDTSPSAGASKGGTTAAYADALKSRELRIRELVDWWRVQNRLGFEDPRHRERLGAITTAALTFLQSYSAITLDQNKETLVLEKKDSDQKIDVRQLSDGERNVFTLILDLSRRLVLANDATNDPLSESRALVLIDEIDLHLHPGWQRTICERLTTTFPNCQFIATTHSPQIIGEVSAEQITIIEGGEIVKPDQSRGMSTNWVLEHLMGVPARDTETQEKLDKIEVLIEEERYETAMQDITGVRQEIGNFPELDALQAHIELIDFLANETETDEE